MSVVEACAGGVDGHDAVGGGHFVKDELVVALQQRVRLGLAAFRGCAAF